MNKVHVYLHVCFKLSVPKSYNQYLKTYFGNFILTYALGFWLHNFKLSWRTTFKKPYLCYEMAEQSVSAFNFSIQQSE